MGDKILTGCGGSVSLLVRPRFTLLHFTLLYIMGEEETLDGKHYTHDRDEVGGAVGALFAVLSLGFP